MSEERFQVECPGGTTTAIVDRAPEPSGALLVHAHGAGGHMEHRTTASLAEELAGRGLDVLRFNFLYREAGRSRPDRSPVLMETFRAVVGAVRERLAPRRLVLGGQSMGGRTASMLVADGFECDGLLLLAYPLHPAGKPERLRDEHLGAIGVPTLCVNGTRDNLCRRDLMDAVVGRLPDTFTMHWVEGADHGFHVLKRSGRTDRDALEEIGEVTERWLPRVG